MDNNNIEQVLKDALYDPLSKVYLNKNPRTIIRYLKSKGFDVEKREIITFLENQKSTLQRTKLQSLRKLKELSRSWYHPQRFFGHIHSDLIILSKYRKYHTQKYMILTAVCPLSNYGYLELLSSTKFDIVKKAWQKIFDRSKFIPEQTRTIISDSGVEYSSRGLRDWLLGTYRIKLNLIKLKPHRLSIGSGIAEVFNRRARLMIEAMISEAPRGSTLQQNVEKAEIALNLQPQSILKGLNATEALRHTPQFIDMLKQDARIRKRKHLKKKVGLPHEMFSLNALVRIRKNQEKQLFFKKESYGHLSYEIYTVLERKIDNFIVSYKLGDIFTFSSISDHFYAHEELAVVNLTYENAILWLDMNIDKIVRYFSVGGEEFVAYKIKGYDRLVSASKNILT